jgi:AcrR family transcriptional regulator
MRYAPEHKENARVHILHAVGRGFRAQGFAGIGVDGLAKEAGVTSGAFYSHFASKAEAFQAAALAGLVELRQNVESLQAKEKTHWLRKFAEFYMSFKRTCDLKDSCALQSLTPEVARASDETKSAYEQELVRLVDAMAEGLGGSSNAARRKAAWSILAMLSGAVTLARSSHDPQVGNQIAKAIVESVQTLAIS